jgi:hypothetical protein
MGQAVEERIEVAGIPHNAVGSMWPMVVEHLAKGLEYSNGEISLDDIYDGLISRDMQLWGAFSTEGECVAAMVTEIINYPRKMACRMIVVGGGHMKYWLDYQTEFMRWAKENGCDRVEAYCRDGMARRLEQFGYKKLYNLCGVDL